MVLKNVTLINFRSYLNKAFQFSPNSTIILGENAVGKTNLLEAIFLLSIGKSFRADREQEMIYWGKEIGRVNATMQKFSDEATKGESVELEVVLTGGIVAGQKAPFKKFGINGVGKRMVDFVGSCKAVLFWPEDLELVIASPSLRRRYLDFVLVQVDREYRRSVISYERGLRQRNRLLEAIREGEAHKHQLLFWDQLLIRDGEYIAKKRREYIDFLNESPMDIKRFPKYKLVYDESVISRSRLDQYKEEEVASGMTLVGPHRDDFIFRIKNNESTIIRKEQERDLSRYGSRGEQRLGILWLKLGEISYVEKLSGEKPILLLDDIFSELDHTHRKVIFDIIGNQQTIMTTTDMHFIEKGLSENVKIIEL